MRRHPLVAVAVVGVAVAAVLMLSSRLVAQATAAGVPSDDWRTITTAHFRIHFPAAHLEWAAKVASRIEAIRGDVARLVGYAPPGIVDVVIEDPSGRANGSALADLSGLGITFWPTPPDPSAGPGHLNDWTELLTTHEFAHIAHLARPSRNPMDRLWLGVPLYPAFGPVARNAPAWVAEGYATLIEGRLTGSGRPHGAWRAAVLREWALEGLLPSYAALDDTGPFEGGSMRYLVGSGFLEWLAAQRGDSSLPHLWRRMTARQKRSFDEAFVGVFGDGPAALYARFRVDMTARALEARRWREAQGVAAGAVVQRLDRETGAPALSADGSLIAIRVARRGAPPRIEIWHTLPEADDSSVARERERARALDPEDVPAIAAWPRPRTPITALHAYRGRVHDMPRFFPDGEQLLVSRPEPRADGAYRADLFVWNRKTGAMRRVTTGAGIRYADPAPDGATAVGVRCDVGRCDLVDVQLDGGAISVLAAGSLQRSYSGARVSPDGRHVASAVHEGGRWRVVIVDRATKALRTTGPDDGASRYDPAWLPDGSGLVVTSDRSGVMDLEIIDRTTDAARPLTRVIGAAVHAEVSRRDRAVYFLELHARGYNLRRISLDSAAHGDTPRLPAALAPVAPPALAASSPEMAPPTAPADSIVARPYGVGPLNWRLLPVGVVSSTGYSGGLALYVTDPAGRTSGLAQFALGGGAAWRGASVGVAWRGRRPAVEADVWQVRQEPSHGLVFTPGPAAIDAEFTGAALALRLERVGSGGWHNYAAGISGGSVAPVVGGDAGTAQTRWMGFVEIAERYRQTPRDAGAWTESIALHASTGVTGETHWRRLIARGTVAARATDDVVIRVEGTYGRVSSDAPAFEQFAVGGMAPWLTPAGVLPQRIAIPAEPPGAGIGARVALVRSAIESGPWQLFYDMFGTGAQAERPLTWSRVLGLELDRELAGEPMLRLPTVRGRVGLAYAIDGPSPGEVRAYFGLTFAP